MRTSYLVPLAAVWLMTACSDDTSRGVTPTTPAASPVPPASVGAAIAIASGNNQQGKAGEPLGEPFVVRVVDAQGNGVRNAVVNFSVTSGEGTLAERDDYHPGASVSTSVEGYAQVTFKPKVLGRSAVTASAAGLREASVTFSADATVLVIERWGPAYDIGFVASPCFCSDVTIPAGTPVEWTNHHSSSTAQMTYTVTSTVTPQGGTPFDSGVLKPNDRFRVVPEVAGIWRYHDKVTGHTGTLTVR